MLTIGRVGDEDEGTGWMDGQCGVCFEVSFVVCVCVCVCVVVVVSGVAEW